MSFQNMHKKQKDPFIPNPPSSVASGHFCPQEQVLADVFCVLCLGFDENLDVQGELILQDSFQVWDPKSLIRKGRERHLFLFEISLVFSKEIKDSSGHTKYVYKNKLLVGVAAKKYSG